MAGPVAGGYAGAKSASRPTRNVTQPILAGRVIGEVTRTRTTDDWIATMDAAKVPCGPINDLERVFQNAQVL
jgi:crotonobetainyl-CoA:carnitine CoA-transferase CaiB-like acyl-CoA transferase